MNYVVEILYRIVGPSQQTPIKAETSHDIVPLGIPLEFSGSFYTPTFRMFGKLVCNLLA